MRRYGDSDLYLGTLGTSDYAIGKYVEWFSDPDVLWRLGRNGQIVSYKMEKEWAESQNGDGNVKTFSIYYKGDLIGNCSIALKGSNGTLGIVIGAGKDRGKGYGSAALKLLLKFAFDECNCHRVRVQVDSKNAGALACYKKAGFAECGVEHETSWAGGEWHDTVTMEILRSDYSA